MDTTLDYPTARHEAIAVFASGDGSNAENLVKYFRNHPEDNIEIRIIVSNRTNAGVIDRAKRLNIPYFVVSKSDFNDPTYMISLLESNKISAIVLAGFLQMIPEFILKAFPNRIINIHPSLLPAYGGKGMYGMRIHQAVIAAGDSQSGITIHIVNEECDGGEILFQTSTVIERDDTPETLAHRIHELEYHHFPRVIASTLSNTDSKKPSTIH